MNIITFLVQIIPRNLVAPVELAVLHGKPSPVQLEGASLDLCERHLVSAAMCPPS